MVKRRNASVGTLIGGVLLSLPLLQSESCLRAAVVLRMKSEVNLCRSLKGASSDLRKCAHPWLRNFKVDFAVLKEKTSKIH